MLFKGLNRDTPERIFVVFQANEANIAADDVVQMDATTDADGVKARQPDTGALYCFLGIADAAVANGDYGLAQVYGYRSTSKIHTTDTTQAAGIPVAPVAGQDYFQSAVTTYATNGLVTHTPFFAALLESLATSDATQSAKVFVRGV